ncbi:elongation of very long chain fatty acids protein 7 [Galendromus occidentalis]|uniref:Elongation of very long chain fatty acids protein n=1 Tax=Galendromus occidentalis TaxID=34638 RepID=A0AAJ7L3J3_9ACAR|nr:elongation of very long chain fatty acids protein 7 [Galendromus occidentalis]
MASLDMEPTQSWLPLPEKDPRVAGWLMLGNPTPIVSILAFYVYIVKVFGPGMMRNAKAYELRPVILLYNAAMVIANLSISTYVIYHAFWTGHYAMWFTTPDRGDHPTTLLLLNVSWYYLVLRLTECIETVLFVLRKRFRQVSTLHVFHHVSVTFSVYFYITYGGFALACFELTFNALIHVVMYGYYFLSACGPSIQKYLWWKKYLTTLQLVQFAIMIARNIMLVFWLNNRYSALPAFMLFQCFVFFLQFFHFYIQSYRQKREEKLQKRAAQKAAQNNNLDERVDDKKSL